MEKIAIVTDSTADLSGQALVDKNITIVPLKVNFGEETFIEGIDITNSQFFTRLEEAEDLPTTSQPSPGDFIKIYQGLIDQGYDSIISIHLSDKMSGTRQSAEIAASEMADKIKNFAAIDSRHITAGIGLIAIKAAESVLVGKSFDHVLEDIEEVKSKLNLFGLVDTLKYLEKGGRIGKARALAGSLLNVKPILAMEDGIIVDIDKVRTRKKGISELAGRAIEFFAKEESLRYLVSHSQALEDALKLEEEIFAKTGKKAEYISEVGVVVGTHIGPGALFLTFIEEA